MPYLKAPAADADLLEIWSYVSPNDLDAADEFLDRFERAFELLAEQPFVGRAREELAPGLRSFPVGSYLVFYRVQADIAQIVRVLNAAQDVESAFRAE